ITPTRPYSFGTGWSMRYDARVLPAAGMRSVGVVRPGGQLYSFTKPTSGTVYTADPDIPDTLEHVVNGGGAIVGYRYTVAASHTVEEFDASGLLRTITEINGLSTTLAYSDASTPPSIAYRPGLLISVTDAF